VTPRQRYAIAHTLGDLGRAIAGLDQDIPALGTESCCDGLCESLDTDEERSAGIDTEFQLLDDRQHL